MKIYEYEGKNKEEIKEKALSELNASENELYIRESEEVSGIFKSKKYRLEILTKEDVVKYIKSFLVDIAKYMGVSVNIEIKKRENNIQVNIFSENSPILIGKNGKNLEALQLLLKNSILNKTGFRINVILDVEDYKEKNNNRISLNGNSISESFNNPLNTQKGANDAKNKTTYPGAAVSARPDSP